MVENDLLEQLLPEGIRPEGPLWRHLKTSQARTAILEAAIKCLAEQGYSKLTTPQIADAAGISRGAMMHHYESRLALVSAAMDYAFYKRILAFRDSVNRLSDSERRANNAGVRVTWELFNMPEHRAYMELGFAAQTDGELRELFLGKARRYDKIMRSASSAMFPEWTKRSDQLDGAFDFVIVVLEGLMLNAEIWNDRGRVESILAFVSETLVKVREGEMSFETPETGAKEVPKTRPAGRAKPAARPRSRSN